MAVQLYATLKVQTETRYLWRVVQDYWKNLDVWRLVDPGLERSICTSGADSEKNRIIWGSIASHTHGFSLLYSVVTEIIERESVFWLTGHALSHHWGKFVTIIYRLDYWDWETGGIWQQYFSNNGERARFGSSSWIQNYKSEFWM